MLLLALLMKIMLILGLRKIHTTAQITTERKKKQVRVKDFISYIDNICMEGVDSEFNIIYFDKKPYGRVWCLQLIGIAL